MFQGLLKRFARGQLRKIGPALQELSKMAYERGYADCAANLPCDPSKLLDEVCGGVDKGIKEVGQ